MNITITGPRSIGKSTISKLLAKKLKVKYISSDKIGESISKKHGGLDKAIKLGIMKELIRKNGYNLVKKVYAKEKNFVFDLSAGSISSTDFKRASQELRKIARKKSIVIGLLPTKNQEKSVNILFKRKQKRKHFKSMERKILLEKTSKHYKKLKMILPKFANLIIYTENKSPNKVVSEIITNLK